MRIEVQQAAGVETAYARQLAANKAVQSVFSEVLAQAGQEGFASAAPYEADAPLSQSVTEVWNSWFQTTGYTRFDDVASPQQLQQDFGQLLLEAHDSGAYAAPQAFLQTLSQDQLATVQQVHRLANRIDVGNLTPEGALNLLLPPPAQVDLNFDGLTQTGIGYSIRFPDSRTPAPVAAAWEAATANLEPGERLTRELQVKSQVLLANIRVDDQGRYSHAVEPGDPDWVNPLADPGFSFTRFAEQTLASIEYFKHLTPPEQYQRDLAFWTAFHDELKGSANER